MTSPIRTAIENDDVIALNQARADLTNAGDERDVNGRNLLQTAIHSGATDAALWLIDNNLGGDINAADVMGETPLMRAAWLGNAEVAGALIAAGSDLNAQARSGGTALHHAHAGGTQAAGMVELLTQAGADASVTDTQGQLASAWEAQAVIRENGAKLLAAAPAKRLSLR